MKKRHINYLIKQVKDTIGWRQAYKYNFENDSFYRKEFYDIYRHKYPKSDVTFRQYVADRINEIGAEITDLEEIISELRNLKEMLKSR